MFPMANRVGGNTLRSMTSRRVGSMITTSSPRVPTTSRLPSGVILAESGPGTGIRRSRDLFSSEITSMLFCKWSIAKARCVPGS